MRRRVLPLGAAMLSLSCLPGANSPGASEPPPIPDEIAHGVPLRVQGEQIVDEQGTPVVLRGVAFGNQVWADVRIPRQHHSEADYQRVADMGMNSVRFYINYKTLESDSAPGQTLADGWKWLDDNVLWASAHGIRLVLNMHVPPGGYQSLGQGTGLWNDPTAQQRLIHLWRLIAERYRNVPTIAGYGLVNEPIVPRSIEEWQALAERLIAAIRHVDPEHIVFVERVNSVGNDGREDENRNFFRVADRNVVYEFHFYKPLDFTHQGAWWTPSTALDQRYPDERVAEVDGFQLDWRIGTFDSPKLPPGNSEWKFYRGTPFKVADPSHQVGRPALVCDLLGSGVASFDDLVLERIDEGAVREIWRANLTSQRGWSLWSQDGSGEVALDTRGHQDAAALSITKTASFANASADYLRFVPRHGATYRLSGWMRGRNVPAAATCQIRLDFLSSRVPVTVRDKDFLRQELDAYVAWGKAQGVPLYLGEWGTIRASYENDRGGLRWSSDMLDLILEHNLGFAYHDYHEQHMGIFYGDGSLPDPKQANTALIELFRSKLLRAR